MKDEMKNMTHPYLKAMPNADASRTHPITPKRRGPADVIVDT
jgi:hypothetical protein